MFNPPITGNKDLDAYLYNLSLNLDGSTNTTEPDTPDIPGGDPGTYTYQYIQVKYATDNTGTGFSDTPTNKTYFGIYNSDSSTESTNPADYTWYLSGFPFGTTYFLYYLILGGRKIKFAVNTSPPDYHWKVDDGSVIDLDILVPSSTISSNEIMSGAVTELKIAANAVTATKLNVAALDQAFGDLRPNTVSAAQIAAGAVSELKLLDGAVTAAKTAVAAINPSTGNLAANSVVASNIQAGTITGDKISANTITGNNIAALTIGAQAIAAQAITSTKIESGAITSDKILAGAVTADKITVNNLAAINANTGNLTVSGTFQANTAVISGSSMTGSGGIIYPNGRFAFGNNTSNVVFDGSNLFINGVSTATANTVTSYNIPTLVGAGPLITFSVTKPGFVTIQTTGSILVFNGSRPFDTTEASFNIVLNLLASGGSTIGTVTVPLTAKLNKYAINAGSGSAYQCNIPFTFTTTTGLGLGTFTLDMTRTDLKFANDTGSVWTSDVPYILYTGYNNVFQGKIS